MGGLFPFAQTLERGLQDRFRQRRLDERARGSNQAVSAAIGNRRSRRFFDC